MSTRLSRAEQVVRNRDLVLAAAREVFVDKGFHAATLDDIAREAGFSKGVVYSQFTSKADLFLTLLERRIDERAGHERALAASLGGIEDYARFVAEARRVSDADRPWTLVVIEFRVLAVRDPALAARYARAHARTVDGMAAALSLLYDRSGVEPPAPVHVLAAVFLGLSNGAALEEEAGIVLDPEHALPAVGRLLGVAG
jgi:AcrR family transcriptional regulator